MSEKYTTKYSYDNGNSLFVIYYKNQARCGYKDIQSVYTVPRSLHTICQSDKPCIRIN